MAQIPPMGYVVHAAVLAATLAVTAAAEPPAPRAVPGRGAPSGGPAVGDLAPDFDLPRLVPATNGAPASVGETIRLSSFRTKRPVILILSSYT